MALKNVIIADDDKGSRIVIKRLLGRDFNIIEAEDGEVALNLLNSMQIDFVILDIVMPKIDGLAVLETVRNNPKFDNVGILVASSTYEHTEREALLKGADDVVSKPYDPFVIKKRIENILARIDYKNHLTSHEPMFEKKISDITTRMLNQIDYLKDNKDTPGFISSELSDLKDDLLNVRTILMHLGE